jgi:hypothetical protein
MERSLNVMKRIILSEKSFNLFKGLLVNEIVVPKGVSFCTSPKDEAKYKQRLKDLETVSNLRTDRYKDYSLEEAYNNWAECGFSKDSEEYRVWCGRLTDYLDYLETGIDFVKGKVNRNGGASSHWAFIDPEWVFDMKDGRDDHQGIYCLTLKLYQNKSIWNDLFFNPKFASLKDDIKYIRGFANKLRMVDKKYSLLLPMEEYIEIGKFMSNPSNAKPELFYEEPKFDTTVDEPEVGGDDEINWE